MLWVCLPCQLSKDDTFARTRRILDSRFSGRRLVVFYWRGDGPNRDITASISNDGRKSGGGRDIASIVGGAEFLRIKTASSDEWTDRSGGHIKQGRLSLWVIGRVSLRVEARSFDQPLGESCQAAADTAFISSWAIRLQVRSPVDTCMSTLCPKELMIEGIHVQRNSCSMKFMSAGTHG